MISCWLIHVFQEKAVKQGETLAEELKASQENSLSQASGLHAKEVEKLQNQVDKLEQELSSSKDKSAQLEKSISELQAYKEQAQVITKESQSHTRVCVFLLYFRGTVVHRIVIFNMEKIENIRMLNAN